MGRSDTTGAGDTGEGSFGPGPPDAGALLYSGDAWTLLQIAGSLWIESDTVWFSVIGSVAALLVISASSYTRADSVRGYAAVVGVEASAPQVSRTPTRPDPLEKALRYELVEQPERLRTVEAGPLPHACIGKRRAARVPKLDDQLF
jgi:hypothetical protein